MVETLTDKSKKKKKVTKKFEESTLIRKCVSELDDLRSELEELNIYSFDSENFQSHDVLSLIQEGRYISYNKNEMTTYIQKCIEVLDSFKQDTSNKTFLNSFYRTWGKFEGVWSQVNK